jgi:hypothetical protein
MMRSKLKNEIKDLLAELKPEVSRDGKTKLKQLERLFGEARREYAAEKSAKNTSIERVESLRQLLDSERTTASQSELRLKEKEVETNREKRQLSKKLDYQSEVIEFALEYTVIRLGILNCFLIKQLF